MEDNRTQHTISDSQYNRINFKSQVEHYQNVIEEMQNKIQILINENKLLSKDRKLHKIKVDHINNKQKEVKNLQEKLRGQVSCLNKHNNQIADAVNELKIKKNAIGKLDRILNEKFDFVLSSLNKRDFKSHNEAKILQQKVVQLESMLKERDRTINELIVKFDELNRTLEEQYEKLQEKDIKIAKCIERLYLLNTQNDEQTTAYQEIVKENKVNIGRLENAKQSIKDLLSKKETYEKSLMEENEKFLLLTKEITNKFQIAKEETEKKYNMQIEKLQSANAQLSTDIQGKIKDVEQLNEKLEQIQEENNEIFVIEFRKQELENERFNKEIELNELKKENIKYIDDIDQLKLNLRKCIIKEGNLNLEKIKLENCVKKLSEGNQQLSSERNSENEYLQDLSSCSTFSTSSTVEIYKNEKSRKRRIHSSVKSTKSMLSPISIATSDSDRLDLHKADQNLRCEKQLIETREWRSTQRKSTTKQNQNIYGEGKVLEAPPENDEFWKTSA